MIGTLYLDTARLGQMSPAARDTYLDFVRLTAEEPSSLYFEKFLQHGCEAWPDSYRVRFAALEAWQGVAGLKQSLARLVGQPPDCRVLLANRSAQLMKLAARLLFRRCRNVLVTDFNWPSYQSILAAEATRTGNTITTVPVRETLLRDAMTKEQLVSFVAAKYTQARCDGLFLPAVSNLGVQFPIREIVRTIESQTQLRFTVVDAAQAFCHVPASSYAVGDLIIAGCHKWLGAYQTMGMAFCPRERSRSFIDRTLRRMVDSFQIDDPLLRFSEQLETGRLDGYSETTNISPLFSCCGAIDEVPAGGAEQAKQLRLRRRNADVLSDVATDSGWRPVRPATEFQTGILLFKPNDRSVVFSAEFVRAGFQQHGIVLSAYDDGLIRLSMPESPLAEDAVAQIRQSLQSVFPRRSPYFNDSLRTASPLNVG